ncbi:hypothetical protein GCM10009612_74330 [Streptomyces beijiangensis]
MEVFRGSVVAAVAIVVVADTGGADHHAEHVPSAGAQEPPDVRAPPRRLRLAGDGPLLRSVLGSAQCGKGVAALEVAEVRFLRALFGQPPDERALTLDRADGPGAGPATSQYSVGHQAPGATSSALLLRALSDVAEESDGTDGEYSSCRS